MRKFAVIIVLFLSLFGIRDLFKAGYYSSHDGTGHVIRMEEFYKAFIDGQIPVRWSGRLYFGYGYPFFNFNYPSTYYLGVPLMAAGFSATDTMKTETIGFFVFSGVLMYLYLQRKITWPYALLGAVLYLYAPYRMSNIYVRGSVAESMAFIFPPLLLWIAEAPSLWGALIIGLIGISHNISTLLLSVFFFGYLFLLSLFNKSFKPILKGAVIFVLGIMMAAFFLVPALVEKKWTFLDLTLAKDYPDHFVQIWQLIKGGWGFGGSVKGLNDGMSFNLGWVQAGLLILLIKFFKFIKKDPLYIFALLILVTSIFFMLPVSKIFWDNIPLLPFVQFPWRFTMLAVPAMAVLGALLISHTKKWLAILLIILTIFLSKGYWHRNQTEFVDKISGDAIEGSTTWAHEQATRWLVPKPDKIPVSKIENAKYEIISWKTGEHKYKISSVFGLVTENTMYYPGWEVFVDGQKINIDYQNGKINYLVSPGNHEVTSKFTETPLRKSMDILSLGTFLSLFFGYMIAKIFAKH